METPQSSQRTPNVAAGLPLVSMEEALWRLALTPLAAELAALIPGDALVGYASVDLARLPVTPAQASPTGATIVTSPA